MDKLIEQSRYNNFSFKKLLENDKIKSLGIGSEIYKPYLRSPYIYYEQLLKKIICQSDSILDLCCGDGVHTFFIANLCSKVVGVDYAENSVKLASIKSEKLGLKNLEFICADVENLNFPEDIKFNCITCVGSLSYVELPDFLNRIKSLLNDGGKFVCIDSFNHNIIYRANRYIHYLRGNRSKSTLNRMPDLKTIAFIQSNFKNVEIRYFGIFSFLGVFLSFFFGELKAKFILDLLDKKFYFLNKYAFKFVLVAQ